ncbi:hypothetical protein [Deinococcus pimensis]|uniref:hypothetical protein n=1 Tax=Deinococcus pimensis TaxID=309888 RepID=UPI00146FC896|nr:hypothetical protein [Deinococcus pimensis]
MSASTDRSNGSARAPHVELVVGHANLHPVGKGVVTVDEGVHEGFARRFERDRPAFGALKPLGDREVRVAFEDGAVAHVVSHLQVLAQDLQGALELFEVRAAERGVVEEASVLEMRDLHERAAGGVLGATAEQQQRRAGGALVPDEAEGFDQLAWRVVG